MKKIISLLAIVLILVPQFQILGDFNSGTAESYLISTVQNPWSTMALSALGAKDISTSHLTNINATSAIELAAPILAITSIGGDPRNFGSSDLIARLESYHDGEQIGDVSTINDDIFGILALVSAGVAPVDVTIVSTKDFVLSKQNADGGWGFVVGGSSDTNITAVGIMSLLVAGVAKNNPAIQDALLYLQSAQNEDGGFPYDPNSEFGTDSDSSSTAWVIWAFNALNIDPAGMNKPGGNPISYLKSLQNSSGYFGYQSAEEPANSFSAVTTAYAVIALSDRSLPLRPISPFFDFRDRKSTRLNSSHSSISY